MKKIIKENEIATRKEVEFCLDEVVKVLENLETAKFNLEYINDNESRFQHIFRDRAKLSSLVKAVNFINDTYDELNYLEKKLTSEYKYYL